MTSYFIDETTLFNTGTSDMGVLHNKEQFAMFGLTSLNFIKNKKKPQVMLSKEVWWIYSILFNFILDSTQ